MKISKGPYGDALRKAGGGEKMSLCFSPTKHKVEDSPFVCARLDSRLDDMCNAAYAICLFDLFFFSSHVNHFKVKDKTVLKKNNSSEGCSQGTLNAATGPIFTKQMQRGKKKRQFPLELIRERWTKEVPK